MLLQIAHAADSLARSSGANQTDMLVPIIIAVILLVVIIAWVTSGQENGDSKTTTISMPVHCVAADGLEQKGPSSPVTPPLPPTPPPPPPPPTPPPPISQKKYIGYNPLNIFAQTEPYNYPYVMMPQAKSVIRFSHKGRTGRKGIKEDEFKGYLTQHFSNVFLISNDRFVPVGNSGKYYEPDIVFIDEKNGKNIFIDIEIDEPYEGTNDISTRRATHYQYADTNRNNSLISRGWIVIRFAEIQVHEQPLQCCLFIADVIRSINSSFRTPSALSRVTEVSSVPQWSKEQAEQWSRDKYREGYLNLPNGFGYVEEAEQIAAIPETEIGQLIEEDVQDLPPFYPPKRNSTSSSNYNLGLVQTAIENSQYLAFKYGNGKTIAKAIAVVDGNRLRALCFVKNKEIEFNLNQVTDIQLKQNFYTTKLSGNIDVNHARNLIRMAMSYNKFLRMRYTKGHWIDGDEITFAEQSLRTISSIGLATDYLENGTNPYRLDNDIHLNAFCNRDDMRKNFRFDRIDEVEVLDI